MNHRGPLVPGIIAGALLASALAGCGGKSTAAGDNPSAAPSVPAGISSPDPAYPGTDKQWFTSLPQPKVVAGTPFKVGFLSVTDEQPFTKAAKDAIAAEVKALGGTFVSYDAQLDPQKQSSQLNQLISQKVDVILANPVVAEALSPGIQAAEKGGIPVLTFSDPSQKTSLPGVETSVVLNYDYQAWETMKKLSEAHPGASFVTMGLGLPVAAVTRITEQTKYWGEQFGLKYEGNVDVQNDSPAGYSAAANAILGKYPDAQLVLTYQGLAGIAMANAAKASGKPMLVSTPNGGLPAEREALKAGVLEADAVVPWEAAGQQLAIAAYDVMSKQNLPLPQYIDIAGPVVGKDDADKAPWLTN